MGAVCPHSLSRPVEPQRPSSREVRPSSRPLSRPSRSLPCSCWPRRSRRALHPSSRKARAGSSPWLLGTPNSAVALLAGASAVDTAGADGPVTSDVPLDGTALQALSLQASGTNLFGKTASSKSGRSDSSRWRAAMDPRLSSRAPSALRRHCSASPQPPPAATWERPGNSPSIAIGDPATSPVSISAGVGALAASAQETAGGVQSGDSCSRT